MVTELNDGMVLYHGSYCEVRQPDLNCCRKFKDFGQGFYLTTDKDQAVDFSLLTTKKAIASGLTDPHQKYGIVSTYSFRYDDDLKIKIFPDPDMDWLHCVVGHRKPNLFNEEIMKLKPFDVIGGKIADDNTNATILAYMAGTFGEIGEPRADEICISLLLPDRLKDQFCFRSEKSLKCLSRIAGEKVWMEKSA